MKEKQFAKAFSLIELIVAMAMMSILVLGLGGLLVSNQRVFQQTYDFVHKPMHEDSKSLTTAFGSIGRRANRGNYKIYKKDAGVYSIAVPLQGESMAKGQAVEFFYWDTPFYENVDNDDVLEMSNTGTHYALFYLENDQIKVDYGSVFEGTGGITEGGMRQSDNCQTYVLANDVDLDANRYIFSHAFVGGRGSGCVNLNVTLRDDDNDTVEVISATLLRADWPR